MSAHAGLPCDGCEACAPKHQHEWTNGPTTQREACDPSPCSHADDHLRVDIILTQTCRCGATRRLWLGYRDRRRRGDDQRARVGRGPLGTPLQRAATFNPPRVLR